jgi:hypothetical protein
MDAVMDVLRQALGDEQSAQRAYAAVHTHTIGFAALEASRSGWQPPKQDPEPPSAGGTASQRTTPSQGFSDNSGLAQRLAAYTTPDQFRQGLAYLLDGIECAARP